MWEAKSSGVGELISCELRAVWVAVVMLNKSLVRFISRSETGTREERCTEESKRNLTFDL